MHGTLVDVMAWVQFQYISGLETEIQNKKH
jgi:hypothetical protein